jgi:hypothetical protein
MSRWNQSGPRGATGGRLRWLEVEPQAGRNRLSKRLHPSSRFPGRLHGGLYPVPRSSWKPIDRSRRPALDAVPAVEMRPGTPRGSAVRWAPRCHAVRSRRRLPAQHREQEQLPEPHLEGESISPFNGLIRVLYRSNWVLDKVNKSGRPDLFDDNGGGWHLVLHS